MKSIKDYEAKYNRERGNNFAAACYDNSLYVTHAENTARFTE